MIIENTWVQWLGWTLLHFLWQGTLIIVIAALVLGWMRKTSANARYLVACGAMFAMLAVPILTLLSLIGNQPTASPATEVVPEPSLPFIVPGTDARNLGDPRSKGGRFLETIFRGESAVNAWPFSSTATGSIVEPYLFWLVSGWLVGLVVSSLRLLAGWFHVQRLKQAGTEPVPREWDQRLLSLADRIGLSRSVRLLQSSLVEGPVLIGWLKPVILVPCGVLTGLPTQQLEAILVHELAHVRRHDFLVNLLQTGVETLLFFHPAVWWLSGRIRQEREHCCDDFALEFCGDPLLYARALSGLEEMRGSQTRLALAAGQGLLLRRIQRMLAAKEQPALSGRVSWVPAAALGVAMVVGWQIFWMNVARADAAGSPMIVDRHGRVLAEPRGDDAGHSAIHYPYGALAAHVLHQLEPPTRERGRIVLTLDARIQSIAERALRMVGRGAAVVVDPATGEILAMVSVPSFDPADGELELLFEDELEPISNRAIKAYAPGASYLLVTSIAGMSAGLNHAQYECGGGVQFGNHFMRCWNHDGHGIISLREALKVSCGSYFYQMSNVAGVEQMVLAGELLHLGKRSGIPLRGEQAGILPGPEWLKVHQEKETWSPGYTANTSIGQGFVLATPLQMALVAATIANGGRHYAPRLIRNQDEAPTLLTDLTENEIEPEELEMLRDAMVAVMNEEGGGGARNRQEGLELAGKTGTAQYWRGERRDVYAWFVGFAPFDDPQFAISVLVEGAQSGGAVSAPIAAQILKEALALEDGDGSGAEIQPLDAAPGHFNPVHNVSLK